MPDLPAVRASDAERESAVVALREHCAAGRLTLGNVDVYVPEGVEVDVGGVVLLGHRREWGRDEPRADAPLVRVSVLALFGTVDVCRVPPSLDGSYRDVIRRVQRQQRELSA